MQIELQWILSGLNKVIYEKVLLTYSAEVLRCIPRSTNVVVEGSIVRKTDTRLGKEWDILVCLPEYIIERVAEIKKEIMVPEKDWSTLVHVM